MVMHPTPTYIYLNMHTFATTTSQPKTTQPTSHSIPKHAYYIINFIYYTLTTKTPTLDILGHHNSTLNFHYTHSHHLSFEKKPHYLKLKLLELPNLDYNFHFFFFPNFQLKTHNTYKESYILRESWKRERI